MRKIAPFFFCLFLLACSATPTPASQIMPSSPTAPTAQAFGDAALPTAVNATQSAAIVPQTATPLAPLDPATQIPTLVPTAVPPLAPTSQAPTQPPTRVRLQEFSAPAGSHPHDVAPAADGGVWYTAQRQGALGYLDVKTGATRQIPLGRGSAPHGVILGPDNAPWLTDSGLNAIVRVEPSNDEVTVFPLPETHRGANLNTAVFDKNGVLWFTGQRGVYGRLDPKIGQVQAWNAPRGAGPYGITTTPNGDVYYASLAASHIARVNPQTGQATVIEPPTPRQGARRVWSDSQGRVWVSEWNVGQVGVYDPAKNVWREWKVPGSRPQPYAVYVDENDFVWLTDFGANALVRFDPTTETFAVYPLPSPGAAVRQLLGRPGEVWGAEWGVDKIVVARIESYWGYVIISRV